MKFRRHHNNKGQRRIKRGATYCQVKRMVKKLGLGKKPLSHGGEGERG